MTTPRLSPSQTVLQYFSWRHLPEPLQKVSGPCADLAQRMEQELPDGPEKTMGLRKLLEAKDCFVRARLESPDKPWWQTSDLNEMRDNVRLDEGTVSFPVITPTEVQTLAEATKQAFTQAVPSVEERARENLKLIHVIGDQCYGPVAIADPEGGQRVARCHYGICSWSYVYSDGALTLSDVQNKHNASGASLAVI